MKEVVDRLVTYAEAVGLESCVPYDPTGPTHMFHAEDFGLSISDWTGIGGGESVLDVSLVFGLSSGNEPGDIASLRMHYSGSPGVWRLEYDLKSDDPPPKVRPIAERFRLVNPDDVATLVHEEALEAGLMMIDFIATFRRRSDPLLSDIPLSRFLANGGRLP